MRAENRIDYVEIPVTDPKRAREFFEGLFGWSFQEWGDDYLSFSDGRLDGGLRRSEESAPATGVQKNRGRNGSFDGLMRVISGGGSRRNSPLTSSIRNDELSRPGKSAKGT